jgi:hypothetical protein
MPPLFQALNEHHAGECGSLPVARSGGWRQVEEWCALVCRPDMALKAVDPTSTNSDFTERWWVDRV